MATIHQNGLFTETGVASMLEAFHYNAVDLLFYFLGSFVDERCGLSETAHIPKVFMKYVDLMNFVIRNYLIPAWSEEEPDTLFKSFHC